MSQPRSIAVIDIGKTNAKVVLIDAETRSQVAARSTPNTVRRDGLYPHMDVEMLWGFITESLKALHAEHGVEGVSITTHGATAALMAGNRLAMPVLDYEHNGPDETSDAYGAARPDFAESLSPRLPVGLNLGAQIFWQSRIHAERFAEVTHILMYPQYWAWRLTGVLASEVTSLGCHTDLWAPDAGGFSSLVANEGWAALFPPVRPAASVLGPITADVAALTGLRSDTPVTCGIHDSNASLLPHLGSRELPFTIVSSGTWTICMTVGGGTENLDPMRDSLANVDAFGRAVPTARFMGGREFDMLAPEPTQATAWEIDRVIAGSIMALPSLTFGVGPFPGRQGGWYGVDPQKAYKDAAADRSGTILLPPLSPDLSAHPSGKLSPGERSAAAALYLALMTQACLDLCELGSAIVLEGPLARNVLFGAALANLTGVPVIASGDSTGTSMGASLLFGGPAGSSSGTVIAPLDHPGFDAYAARWRAAI